ncbi:MAG: hypothetical protein H6R10_3706 [Rhodocyclaceae bacterium]|nr:hypothetical protein [Rhodocyclaceae bacterium]
MTTPRRWLLPAIALLLGFHAAPLMAISVDPLMAKVISWPDARLNSRRAERPAPALPPGPSFEEPRWASFDPKTKLAKACAMVKNPLGKPITVLFFSANWGSPLLLLPEEGGVLKRRPRGPGEVPLPPPAPPPLMLFDLPARSSVNFCAETSLADFDYEPGSEARIDWSFDWRNPPPEPRAALRGVLTIQLP